MKQYFFRACIASLLLVFSLIGCSSQSPEARIASARRYLAKQQPQAAVIELKNVLQTEPDRAEARFLLGQAFLDNEDPVAAIVEFDKAQELHYDLNSTAPATARALLMMGQPGKVIERFTGLSLSSPAAMADLETSLAVAFADQGADKQSDAALQIALTANPADLRAKVYRSRLLAAKGRLEEAQGIASEVLRLAPSDAEALQLQGDLYMAKSDWPNALTTYKKAITAHSNAWGARIAVISGYLARGDLSNGRTELDALKRLRPGHPSTRYFEAFLAYQQRDIARAEEIVQQLLRLVPDNPKVLELAGAIASEKGSLSEAEQLLARSLQERPKSESLRRLLASVQLRAGRPARAIETLRPLLERKEPDAKLLSMAAMAYMQNGESVKADEYFEKALKAEPKSAASRTAVALLHGRSAHGGVADELEQIAESDQGVSADVALIGMQLQQRDFGAALGAIAGFEKKRPKDPYGPYMRGQVLLLQGQFADARRAQNQALEIDANYFPSVRALCALDLRDNKAADAEQRLDAILKADPRHLQALVARAELAVLEGKREEDVVALFAKAVSLRPDDLGVRIRLVNYLLQQRDQRAALNAAQNAASSFPDSVQALELLARTQIAAGETNQAIGTYGKLTGLQPNSPGAYIGLAEAQIKAKATEAGRRSLQRALELQPDSLEARRRLIGLELSSGHPDAALAVARERQVASPTSAQGWILEGDVQASRQNWKVAADNYRTAMNKADGQEGAVERLHSVLRRLGDRAKADSLGATWQAEHPDDVRFGQYFAGVAIRDKDYPLAEERFRKIVKSRPDDAIALNNLAFALLKQNKPEAREVIQRANQLRPNEPAIMDTWALVLLEGGDTGKALEIQRKAIALQPNSAPLHLTLAKILLKEGDKAAARRELDQLSSLGKRFPEHEEVDQLRNLP